MLPAGCYCVLLPYCCHTVQADGCKCESFITHPNQLTTQGRKQAGVERQANRAMQGNQNHNEEQKSKHHSNTHWNWKASHRYRVRWTDINTKKYSKWGLTGNMSVQQADESESANVQTGLDSIYVVAPGLVIWWVRTGKTLMHGIRVWNHWARDLIS